jgi:hypothetical protein
VRIDDNLFPLETHGMTIPLVSPCGRPLRCFSLEKRTAPTA